MTARRVGRPLLCPEPVLQTVIELREHGSTLQAICDHLNERRILTPAGRSRWQRQHVSRLVKTDSAKEIAAHMAARTAA